MKIREILKENRSMFINPVKVTNFDKQTRQVEINGKQFKLSPLIKELPGVGYNYAFEILNNEIIKIIAMTVDNVITTGNEVLMIKRKSEPYAGHWALPGGFIDQGESPAIAAARELKEETGMNVNPASLRFIGKFDNPYRDPRMQDTWTFAFMLKAPKERVKAGDDASDAKWIPISEINKLPLAFDHIEILKKAGVLIV